jgi:hypothetical protein
MPEVKQRHGCLTAWLILMIVVNSLAALVYIFASGVIKHGLPNAPAWAFPALAVLGIIANVVFAIALFQWKKWGFLGFVGTSILAFVINLILGLNIVQVLFGLLGVLVLYGVLQIGEDKKGWTQLE